MATTTNTSISKLKINPEYQNLIRLLTVEEYSSLRDSIKREGQLIKIIANTEGVIIEGHHRYQICQELGLEPKVEYRGFANELDEKLCIISCNLSRRHLTNAERIEIGHKIKPIYQELASRNQSLAGKNYGKGIDDSSVSGGTQLSPIGRVDDVVAKEVGLSTRTFQRGEAVLVQNPEAFEKLIKKGNKPIYQVERSLKLQEKRKQLQQQANALPLINEIGIKLLEGDFREKSDEIPDNSVDLLFCDPPYKKENISLYTDLARIAERVLKTGGSLIMYFGGYSLPDIIYQLHENSKLKWNWELVVQHTGPSQAMHGPKVFVRHKSLLWYIKGDKNNAPEYIDDTIISKPPDKTGHDWAQSTVEAEQCISRLTLKNQVIFDPFMGAGTTGIAAINLNRQFIGIEIDENSFNIAKGNIIMMMKKREGTIIKK